MKSKKTRAQLDREIGEALATHSTKRSRLSPDVSAAFASMVDNAEADAAENLFLGRRNLGYTGDPKEFRFSPLFARLIPGAKHDRLLEIIEEHSQHPHRRLGRTLTASEANRLLKEAGKIYNEELALARAL